MKLKPKTPLIRALSSSRNLAPTSLALLLLVAGGCRDSKPNDPPKTPTPQASGSAAPGQTPGGASGGAAGVQSSSEHKSNPPDKTGEPSSR